MVVLTRKGNEVYFGEEKLTIVAQASKGEGKEAVKIEGLEGSNGQKWVQLSKLSEGENHVECKARENTGRRYHLTDEEQAEVDELQARINAIIENAKSRYVPKSKKPEDMSEAELKEHIASLEAMLAKLK